MKFRVRRARGLFGGGTIRATGGTSVDVPVRVK